MPPHKSGQFSTEGGKRLSWIRSTLRWYLPRNLTTCPRARSLSLFNTKVISPPRVSLALRLLNISDFPSEIKQKVIWVDDSWVDLLSVLVSWIWELVIMVFSQNHLISTTNLSIWQLDKSYPLRKTLCCWKLWEERVSAPSVSLSITAEQRPLWPQVVTTGQKYINCLFIKNN